MGKSMTLTINGGKPDNITFTNRELANQWDREKNGDLSPEMFDANSTKAVFWKCPVCKGSWRKGIAFRTHKDNGCPYCNNRKLLKGFNDLRSRYPEIADMWSPEHNDGVEADEVMYAKCHGTRTWHCPTCDELFDSNLSTILRVGCPRCRDYKRMRGKHISLSMSHPDIAGLWDEKRNGMSAEEFLPWKKYGQLFWWRCDTCGQSYQMTLSKRLCAKGCPVCQGKIVIRGHNDIETLRPDVSELWSDKNGEEKPWMYTTGSGKRAWFRCPECEKDRYVVIAAECNISVLCKKCAAKKRTEEHIAKHGSLADRYPILREQWHRTKNGDVTPDMVAPTSDFDAYWYCEKHKYTWHARVVTRTKARTIGNCPKCVADDNRRPEPGRSLRDLYPDIADEWDYDRNGGLRPEDFAPMSHKYVYWKCPTCKESYLKRISHRTVSGRGCECTFSKFTSFPEKAIFYYVSMAYPDALPNHTPDIERFGRRELDIYIPSISTGIEYDGEYWHQDSEKDQAKDEMCFVGGIFLIRVREPKCPKYDLTVCYREVERRDKSPEALDECIREVLSVIGAPREIDVDTERDRPEIQALVDGGERREDDAA